jgi:hypothetical protein
MPPCIATEEAHQSSYSYRSDSPGTEKVQSGGPTELAQRQDASRHTVQAIPGVSCCVRLRVVSVFSHWEVTPRRTMFYVGPFRGQRSMLTDSRNC